MLAFAMFMSVCGAVMVMSSAYVVTCTECWCLWECLSFRTRVEEYG